MKVNPNMKVIKQEIEDSLLKTDLSEEEQKLLDKKINAFVKFKTMKMLDDPPTQQPFDNLTEFLMHMMNRLWEQNELLIRILSEKM